MTRYQDIAMPERFVLEFLDESGEWIEHGWYGPEVFARDNDGTYVCSGYGSSPLYLRCLRQAGNIIYVVDGTGQPFTYRMAAVAGDHP